MVVNSQSKNLLGKADGMVTDLQDKVLAILTADCAPVLFFDPIRNIIGAAHAGWRGTLIGILENTVDAMLTLGATKRNIIVAVGPCISKENYEVGEDLRSKVISHNKKNDKYFFSKHQNKYLFDLCGYIIGRLNAHGIKSVEALNICTYNIANNFYSYRYAQHSNHPNHSRNMTLIKL